MTTLARATALQWALAVTSALSALPARADAPGPPPPATPPSLEQQFRDPPNSARPRVWWHWLNGNITKDGIARDIDWMHRMGIGGMQTFDANLQSPQIVDHRLVYMTPEWKDALRFAASEADRLGLELGIASSPGWSETGGPWVPPADGLKKLVWSEASLAGGQAFRGKLPAPPAVTGPFQALAAPPSIEEMISGVRAKAPPAANGDIAVLAVPATALTTLLPRAGLPDGTALAAARLNGGDLATGIAVPRGSAGSPGYVLLTYDRPQTVASARVFVAGAKMMFGSPAVAPTLEVSDDGKTWRKLAVIDVADVPTTVSFTAMTARFFRLVMVPLTSIMANLFAPAAGIDTSVTAAMSGGTGPAKPWDLRELQLLAQPAVDRFETKAGFAITQDYYQLANPADGAIGPAPAQVLDITRYLRPDGTLDWTAPRLPPGAGHWRILRFGWSLLGTTNHPATPEATGLEVDKFDGAAVRRYMDHYLTTYRDAQGRT